jgi:hypothetical protein
MIEFTTLEVVLMVAVVVLVVSYFGAVRHLWEYKRAMAVLMVELHHGRVRTVDLGKAIAIERVRGEHEKT